MDVIVVLAGINDTNVQAAHEKIEELIGGLGNQASFCYINLDEEAKSLEEILAERPWDLIIAGPTVKAKDLTMRAAAKLSIKCHSDVSALKIEDGEIKVIRNIYSGHGEAVLPSEKAVLTLMPFREGGEGEDLSKAKVVLIGGKGLGNKANFQRLERLAEKLGAACGCSRLAALTSWADYEKVVGISGSMLSADVCIAFGVSGAGPFMQGVEGVGKLIAVNNDEKAPIFKQADYGIVADCMTIIEAMEEM